MEHTHALLLGQPSRHSPLYSWRTLTLLHERKSNFRFHPEPREPSKMAPVVHQSCTSEAGHGGAKGSLLQRGQERALRRWLMNSHRSMH